ncbi:hypothetical protein [Absidia glauca]|uniref:Uncharacterized protein n=1 Tax=Absidia glauca TaxID=4829 RepID=A0A168LIE5_ABSGL|nr:hypothetical protein [Absidia glauca]
MAADLNRIPVRLGAMAADFKRTPVRLGTMTTGFEGNSHWTAECQLKFRPLLDLPFDPNFTSTGILSDRQTSSEDIWWNGKNAFFV